MTGEWGWLLGLFLIGVGAFSGGAMISGTRLDGLAPGLAAIGLVLIAVSMIVFGTVASLGRDLDGRFAASPLRDWFDHLASGKGRCCSDADGTALSDVDWETKDGHYRVRIEGQWWDVPDDAVIKEPNRAGRTMVWPIYYRALGSSVVERVDIRCFIPGSMT